MESTDAPKRAPPPLPPARQSTAALSTAEDHPDANENVEAQVQEEVYYEEEIPTEIENGSVLQQQTVAPGRYRWYTVTVEGSEDDLIEMRVTRLVNAASANIYVNVPPSEYFPTEDRFDWSPTKGPLHGPPGVYRIAVLGVPSFIEKDDKYLVDPSSNWASFDIHVEWFALDEQTKATLKKVSEQYTREKASAVWSQSYSQEFIGKYNQQREDSERELQERIKQLNVQKEISLDNTPIPQKYVIGSLIGSSNEFSFVKKATEKANNNNAVALKVIDKVGAAECGIDEKTIQNQIKILQSAKHPNIAALKDQYEDSNVLVLVLELLEGGDLVKYISSLASYTEDNARKLVAQILEAIKFLHANRIVHKSIVPDNIAVTADGSTAKLIGFTLSSQEDTEGLTVNGGDPAYQAPEIINRTAFGKSVDIWAAGCVAYFLLSGYSPFADTNTMRLYSKIRQGNYQFPDNDWKDVSTEAKDFIKELLCVDASKRLTAEAALGHPWLKKSGGSSLPNVITNVKKIRA